MISEQRLAEIHNALEEKHQWRIDQDLYTQMMNENLKELHRLLKLRERKTTWEILYEFTPAIRYFFEVNYDKRNL
jgi:hypothetical protein